MNLAPDFSKLVEAVDVWSIVRPILLVADVVLMLILAVVAVDNILKLMGYDWSEINRQAKREQRHRHRFEKESDADMYAKWKRDRAG